MEQLALSDIDRLSALLQSESDVMFQRTLPVMTAANIEHIGSICNNVQVRVDSNGMVTADGKIIGYADGFTIPIKNCYAGTPITVTYKTNPSEWITPRNSNRNKRMHSKEHKRVRRKIATASRKRNRK